MGRSRQQCTQSTLWSHTIMVMATITCDCNWTVQTTFATKKDAEIIAEQHEQRNARRAYAHDTNVITVEVK